MPADHRRRLPRTDALLADPRLADAHRALGRGLVREAVRRAQEQARAERIAPEAIVDTVLAELPSTASSLNRVLNATGVIVHTNLGRAPLSAAAVAALVAAAGSTDVELDLDTGQRGRRGRGAVEALATAVPDAPAVHIVNNCAAALALVATTLAQGREIIVSRGEFVEIGDGFRIPELLASTGARIVEVGTTNRTTVADYEQALTRDTGCILKIHPSNFTVSGFTAQPSVSELSGLGAPLIVDIGSGLLYPSAVLPDEPDAATTLRAGADLVVASGDKLLGGPQCGLLLGDEELVSRLRRHPLGRALRVDKLTTAALEATLRGPRTPVAAMLEADHRALWGRAEQMAAALAGTVDARIVQALAVVGGGGAPGQALPDAAVALPPELAEALRRGRPPVLPRVDDGRCLLHLRTIDPDDDPRLTDAVRRAATGD